MRKVTLICLAFLFPLFAAAQTPDYGKLFDKEGVTYINVTKAMMNMFSDQNENVGGVKIGKIVDKLNSIQIFASETEAASRAIKEAFTPYAADKKYEELITAREDGVFVKFIGKKVNDHYSEVMFYMVNGKDAVFMIFDGNLELEDIQKLIGK